MINLAPSSRTLATCLAAVALPAAPVWAGLRIAELQSSNLSTIEDETGSSSDWIEILNDGEQTVELEGWFLTDDPENLNKWSFPDIDIKAGKSIVIWASGRDTHTPLTLFEPQNITKTHTNFRLSSNGEYVALVRPDEVNIEDEIPAGIPQGSDISYGLSSDGFLGYFAEPTPGEANPPLEENVGPVLRDPKNLTGEPVVDGADADTEIVVSVSVSPTFHAVSEVRLVRRFMFKGEAAVVMRDDGQAPDETEGDGTYTGSIGLTSIFGPQLAPGEMARWRFEAEDEAGNTTRLPRFENPDDADEYFGTIAYDSSVETSNLPILHQFIENPTAANTDSGTKCSLYYLGEFYDNIQIDIHGQSTRSFPKKSYDLDFNRGNRFRYREGEDRVKDINMLSNWADKAKVRNTMAYELYELGGVKGHFAFAIRIQQNGEFHSTADFVEDGDNRFLERAGLNSFGALYKMYNNLGTATGEKKNREFENDRDLQDLVSGITRGSSQEKELYVYDNVDIPATVNFLVMNGVMNNSDYGHKNYYVYRDSDISGEWTMLPWDVDLSLGRKWGNGEAYFHDPIHTGLIIDWNGRSLQTAEKLEAHIHGNVLAGIFMRSGSDLNDMIWRRFRTLTEEFYGAPGEAPRNDYLLRRLDELTELIDPEGVTSDADLDYEKWGSWGNRETMREGVERIRSEFIPGRKEYAFGEPKMPNPQTDAPNLVFDTVEFSPASNNQEEEYFVLQNRSATTLDVSEWTVEGAVEHTFLPGTVLLTGSLFTPDRGKIYLVKNRAAFRARSEGPGAGQGLFIQGDYGGQLSARGETIRILDREGNVVAEHSFDGDPSPLQDALRITEFHAAPLPDGDGAHFPRDYEFIELHNIGEGILDLTGAYFGDGVELTFAAGTSLKPGEYGVVVADEAAFRARYGSTALILGVYEGNLNNNGERVQLNDARGENIIKFDYDDDWIPAGADAGRSLVIVDPQADFDSWGDRDRWAVSEEAQGSPGSGPGAIVDPNDYAAWAEAHFTPEELGDPAVSGPDADANGDGFVNLLAYAVGSTPDRIDLSRLPDWREEEGGERFLRLRYRRGADDLTAVLEVSPDGASWEIEAYDEVGSVNEEDDTVTVDWKPAQAAAERLYRVRFELAGNNAG